MRKIDPAFYITKDVFIGYLNWGYLSFFGELIELFYLIKLKLPTFEETINKHLEIIVSIKDFRLFSKDV